MRAIFEIQRLDSIFRAHQIDAVIHFVALAFVGESVTAPSQYYDVNVHGTRVLLDTMVKAGVSTIVFSSSCAVYGEPAQTPIAENAPTEPVKHTASALAKNILGWSAELSELPTIITDAWRWPAQRFGIEQTKRTIGVRHIN